MSKTQTGTKYIWEVIGNYLEIKKNGRLILKTNIQDKKIGLKKMFLDNSYSFSSSLCNYKTINNRLIITPEESYPIELPFNNEFIKAMGIDFSIDEIMTEYVDKYKSSR